MTHAEAEEIIILAAARAGLDVTPYPVDGIVAWLRRRPPLVTADVLAAILRLRRAKQQPKRNPA